MWTIHGGSIVGSYYNGPTMVTEEYLDRKLYELRTQMTRELIEYIDLKIDMKTEPLAQMQNDIKLIKECLIELTVGLNSLKTDYRMLKEENVAIHSIINDHEKRIKKLED